MKTGIIGLPQVGKTSLFVMLTKQQVAQRAQAIRARRISASPRFPTIVSTAWPRSTTPRN